MDAMQERTAGKTHFSKERYALGEYQRFTTTNDQRQCSYVHVFTLCVIVPNALIFITNSRVIFNTCMPTCASVRFLPLVLGANVSGLVCCIF